MKTRNLLPIAPLFLAILLLAGCSKDNLPEGLTFSVLNIPARLPLMTGPVALVYEVMVKNTSIDKYSFQSVDVKDGSSSLLSLTGTALDNVISVYHSTLKTVGAGETAFLFMWVEFPADLLPPETFTQTISLTRVTDGKQFVTDIKVSVNESAPVVLSVPLKARRYAAVGAPSNDSYHRRTINFLDDKFWTSDRYAIDFIGLDDGQRYRVGRENSNADYFGYQDVVYSATAGEVVSVVDTISENTPPLFPEVDPANLFRAGGNQVVIKMSAGVYIFYGHMVRAGSDLKVGDKVEAGQPIGRLGNSGNVDAPQLHLQVMDGPDPWRSNGIPWVFDHFVLEGSITGYDRVDGLIKAKYLNIRQTVTDKNFKGDAVVGIE